MSAQIPPGSLTAWQVQSPRSHHAKAAHSVTGVGEKAETAIDNAA